MRTSRSWPLAAALLVVGCGKTGGSNETPGSSVAGATVSPPGIAGATPLGNANIGTGGAPNASGGAGGGSMLGSAGAGGMQGVGTAGGAGTNGANGTGGRSGSGGAGGISGSAGAAGGAAGSCAQTLACTLMAAPSTGDIRQDCVDRINQFRTQCACLPPLARWTDGEACADQMAQYDSTMSSMPHAGFMARICSGGTAQDECPGYRSDQQVIQTCLQQMWSEGPGPMNPCTGSCYQTHGHFINMTSSSTTRVACGFFTTSNGQLWAVQNFSR